MKNIITLTFIALVSLGVNAQSLLPTKYGIKVGANIANIISTPNNGVENIDNTSLIGLAGGFYMEIALNDKWYINPEVVYAQKGASFDYDFIHDYDVNHRDEHNTTNELKLSYVELNPTISYKTPYKVALNFGPSVSYLIQSDYIPNETHTSTSEVTNHELLEESIYTEESLDVGLNLGISYYLNEDFLIDGKVSTGFMKIGQVSQEIYTGDASNEARSHVFELKNRNIVFSIAYLF
jgi:long-subunit fatty acid transport protein